MVRLEQLGKTIMEGFAKLTRGNEEEDRRDFFRRFGRGFLVLSGIAAIGRPIAALAMVCGTGTPCQVAASLGECQVGCDYGVSWGGVMCCCTLDGTCWEPCSGGLGFRKEICLQPGGGGVCCTCTREEPCSG